MENDGTRLLGLFQIMSEELANATPRGEGQKFALQRQAERLRKRARLGVVGLDIKALVNFKDINNRVRDLVPVLDPFIEHNARLFIVQAFERYNKRWDPELIQIAYDHRHLDRFWRFGPGASNGVKGTHTAEKLVQPMTATPSAIPLVQRLRNSNVYLHAYDIGNGNDGISIVNGSRLTTVPKNEDTERTIAIEPSGNMALQLAVGCYIQEVLESIGLDIRSQQPLNKALALRGSVDDDLVTIDMTSASDMFSMKLVRQLLPPGLFDTMLRIRSPETELPDGEIVPLYMMSTMGNGFTFPMMTLIFTALIYAVRLSLGGPRDWIDWSNTAVFGDDIIVPTAEATLLISTLEGCGFLINREKSYVSGPFRESCGGDYYLGRDVTPVYVKTLASNSDVYVAINRVFEWCAEQNYLLYRTITYLGSLINGEVFFVPEWVGNDSGFRTTCVQGKYKYLKPAMKQVKTKCPHFDMMLAVGGYTLPSGPDIVYTPRPFKTRYVVRRSRLPRGYLDGRDAVLRHPRTSAYVETYSFLLQSF